MLVALCNISHRLVPYSLSWELNSVVGTRCYCGHRLRILECLPVFRPGSLPPTGGVGFSELFCSLMSGVGASPILAPATANSVASVYSAFANFYFMQKVNGLSEGIIRFILLLPDTRTRSQSECPILLSFYYIACLRQAVAELL